MERRSSSIRSIRPSSPIPIRSIAACAKRRRSSRRRRACGGKDFVGNLERRYGGLARMSEPAVAGFARTMLVLDPPDHTRLRALVTKAFTARRVADMRPRIKALVDAQLDRVVDTGGMDVMRDLAHRLPVIVI
jgi:cytochrome P450